MAGNSVGDNAPAGDTLGATTSNLISFYGATPIAQKAAAGQAQVTDASTGTAAATNGIAALTATYNSTILANAIATLAAAVNAANGTLTSLGAHKGSA